MDNYETSSVRSRSLPQFRMMSNATEKAVLQWCRLLMVHRVTALWGNGFSGNNNTNIPAGTYTVTVTDGAGCTVTKTFKITEPRF
ncbi:MAG: hypothetical protein U0T81_13435 [Saprospiraceae bacterium]